MPTTLDLAVPNASEDLVIQAGARLGLNESVWPFVPAANPIVKGQALRFIESMYDTAPSAAAVVDLGNYLALSTSAHVFDGWRYLSQSALAFLNGARNEALHLAYYAELRAALSILAGSGVAILKFKHFALTSTGGVHWFQNRTHAGAWAALRKWAMNPANAVKVADSLTSFGFTASEWADAGGAKVSTQAIIEHWLMAWSIDLTSLSVDSTRRNEATYRPDLSWDALNEFNPKHLHFICDINSCADPEGPGEFRMIDRALIFDLLKTASELNYGDTAPASLQKVFANVLRSLTHPSVGLSKEEAFQIIRELRRIEYSPARDVLLKADTNNEAPDGVFSRAFLLLRLASALMRRQWREATKFAPLGDAPWQAHLLKSYGKHCNLFDENTFPTSYDTLDEDQLEAQDELEAWTRNKPNYSAASMWKAKSDALNRLCRLEKVGIWASVL